jgi:hypothetical protein
VKAIVIASSCRSGLGEISMVYERLSDKRKFLPFVSPDVRFDRYSVFHYSVASSHSNLLHVDLIGRSLRSCEMVKLRSWARRMGRHFLSQYL